MKREEVLKSRIDYAISKNGKCLNNSYPASKIFTFICCKNHKFTLTIQETAINKSNKWCYQCRKEEYINNLDEKLKNLKDYAIRRGGNLLSNDYFNNHAKYLFKCNDENHPEFELRGYAALNLYHWCPKCAKRGRIDFTETKEYLKIMDGWL